mgnify:CR=1 FL=1
MRFKKKFYTFKNFGMIFIPLIILISLTISIIYSGIARYEKEIIKRAEINRMAVLREVISDKFKLVVSDLRILSEQYELKYMLEEGTGKLENLAVNFVSFAKRKRVYDQIRFIDKRGMEVLRVNYNRGQPVVVSKRDLQYKGEYYYFKDIFQLDKGEVFVSPFDLNIERGEIEEPYKPMIRFGTPLFDKEGQRRGIIILNYLGADLLRDIERLSVNTPGELMLLNSEGFWLKGPKSEDEWGFMLTNRKDRKFSQAYPAAWERISKANTGQFYSQYGLFTFSTVFPLKEAWKSSSGSSGMRHTPTSLKINGKEYYWKIVSLVRPAVLNLEPARFGREIFPFYLVIAVIIFAGSWFITRSNIKLSLIHI